MTKIVVRDGMGWIIRMGVIQYQLCGPVGRKMIVSTSNPFLVVFGLILVPTLNFIRIGQKTQKILVLLVGFSWSGK